MPNPPPLDGLPLWLQIVLTLAFGGAALGVAYKGYFIKDKHPDVQSGDKQTAAIMAATIADMGAIRHLSDCVVRLTGVIETLTRAVEEQAHHERNSNDTMREMCARLRGLSEELVRQGMQAKAWDKRDEARRD